MILTKRSKKYLLQQKNRETEKFYQPESQLLYKCDKIEKEIQNLQEYINSNYDAPQNELIQKELIMIKSSDLYCKHKSEPHQRLNYIWNT